MNTKFWSETWREEDLDVDRSWRNRMGGWWLDSSGSVYGTMVGSCEHCNKHSGFI